MNSVQEILAFSKRDSNRGFVNTHALIAEVCKAKFKLHAESFYAIQRQLSATQRAWNAIIAEKERYDIVGWQAGSAEFTRALHACLITIPRAVNMDLPAASHDVQDLVLHEEPGMGGFSSNSGSIPLAYDDGNDSDLPDYESSLGESEDLEAEFDDLQFASGGDQGDEHRQTGERDGSPHDDRMVRLDDPFMGDIGSRRAQEQADDFDPWKMFLDEQASYRHPESRKRQRDEAAREEMKAKRRRA